MSTYSDLVNDIQQYVTNYPPKAFLDNRLQNILLRISQWIQSGGTTGPVVSPGVTQISQANFINATDCPIPALNGQNIVVFYNAVGRPLIKGGPGAEWADYPGGGFTILIPTWDSAVNDANFLIFVSA